MSTNRPAGRGERSWAVSGWSLRRKVALALAVPLLLAGTLGGLRVHSDLVEASNSSSSARQVGALRPAVDYLVAAERAMVTAVGEGTDEVDLRDALADVRDAGRELAEAAEYADLTEEQRYQVEAVLDLSQALRADDAPSLSPGAWVAQLRQLQSGVTQLITTIVNEQINPEPRLELLSHALAGRFSLAMQQALVATDRAGETSSLELFSELGVEGAAIDRLAGALGASEDAVGSLRTANAQRFRTVRTGGTELGGVEAYAGYDAIIRKLQSGVDTELAAAAAQARTAAAVNAVITLAALAAAVLLALLISRLLLNPIRRVREGALAVAHDRLPEAVARIRAGEEPGEISPIDVATQEEIGQLARAVDDMHRQAVVLASGEADLRAQVSQMFVTLSRRNTSLVNQQLGLIERLERDEEDPKRLDSLFRLDHLAARMRRTADSLLILADAPTTATVAEGLTVGDALQAATAGVQDYQRVQVRSANPTRIDPGAAADVVHLLTELVDNALTYSPPTSTVSVDSRTTPRGVQIEVEDAGLGIPADELATINASLRSGGEVTPETARRMGLFVVSRLSQRHGMTTSLRVNDEGGTTATVLLPFSVLPDVVPPPTATPRPPSAEQDTPGSGRPTAAVGSERKTGRPERTPAPVTAEQTSATPLDVSAWIDAARGLPVRRPGLVAATPSTGQPEAGSQVEPSGGPAVGAETEPVPGAEPGSGAGAGPGPAVEAVSDSGPEADAGRAPGTETGPEPETGEEPDAETAEESLETIVAAVTGIDATDQLSVGRPAADAPGRDGVRAPAPAPGSRGASPAASALDGDWTDSGEDGRDTPIFRSLRSAWLSSDGDAQPWRTTEIEAGWEKADEVADTPTEPETSESGLPLRRPGRRLVPGGVTTAPTVTARDPETVRARLSAHAAGVSRGRAAATAQPPTTSRRKAGS